MDLHGIEEHADEVRVSVYMNLVEYEVRGANFDMVYVAVAAAAWGWLLPCPRFRVVESLAHI